MKVQILFKDLVKQSYFFITKEINDIYGYMTTIDMFFNILDYRVLMMLIEKSPNEHLWLDQNLYETNRWQDSLINIEEHFGKFLQGKNTKVNNRSLGIYSLLPVCFATNTNEGNNYQPSIEDIYKLQFDDEQSLNTKLPLIVKDSMINFTYELLEFLEFDMEDLELLHYNDSYGNDIDWTGFIEILISRSDFHSNPEVSEYLISQIEYVVQYFDIQNKSLYDFFKNILTKK